MHGRETNSLFVICFSFYSQRKSFIVVWSRRSGVWKSSNIAGSLEKMLFLRAWEYRFLIGKDVFGFRALETYYLNCAYWISIDLKFYWKRNFLICIVFDDNFAIFMFVWKHLEWMTFAVNDPFTSPNKKQFQLSSIISNFMYYFIRYFITLRTIKLKLNL